MSTTLRLLATLCVLFPFMAGERDLRAQDQPCIRPPAQTHAVGATIVLRATSGFPCKAILVDKGVALQADADGRVSAMISLTRGLDGRFYSSTMRGEISVWARDGKFLHNYGRIGKGPGEFAQGPKHLKVDNRGRLWVVDNNLRWSIFDASGKFERTVPAATLGWGIRATCCAILDDGTFLSGWTSSNAAFRILDVERRDVGTPPVLRAFGPAPSSERAVRRVAYAGGNTFWAAPAGGAAQRYELEEWRTDGTLLRRLRREAPWVPASIATDVDAIDEPDIVILHIDKAGLLNVELCIKLPAFASLTREDKINGRLDKGYDCYNEVIDTRNNVILASTGVMKPSEAHKRVPAAFFNGVSEGYQYTPDADGLPGARIVEIKLVKR